MFNGPFKTGLAISAADRGIDPSSVTLQTAIEIAEMPDGSLFKNLSRTFVITELKLVNMLESFILPVLNALQIELAMIIQKAKKCWGA